MLPIAVGYTFGQTYKFTSPNGVVEECRVIPHIPGGHYSHKDVDTEHEYCAIDFYDQEKVALCPKVWSTSPGTMVADISQTGKGQREFENQSSCGASKRDEFFVKFKQSINQTGTSGTFSQSSLLYYHMARFFDTTVEVPVAVYRTMDEREHLNRVSKKAALYGLGKSEQNRVGWNCLYKSELDPESYKPTSDLFTSDRKQIYGVLVGGGGVRYGPEVNGVRSYWGMPQVREFMKTPAFLALMSPHDLNEAMRGGVAEARRNKQMSRALGTGVSDLQMFVWTKELSEIALLDFIFSQQDRVGNVDFKWQQLEVNSDGGIHFHRIRTKSQRSDMVVRENVIQRSQINDNDAGARTEYTNFTKKAQMCGFRGMAISIPN